jgi:hypothetical protein
MFPARRAFLGYALVRWLLLCIGRRYWAPLVYPLWALMINVYVLLTNLQPKPALRALRF